MRTDREILQQFADALVPELKAVSKGFADSIESEVTEDTLTIKASPYINTLIYGRGPTKSGAKKGTPTLQQQILKWVESKSITPRANSRGKVPTQEQLSWAISKSIHRDGTKLYQEGGKNDIFGSIITQNRLASLQTAISKNYLTQIETWANGISNNISTRATS